MQKVIQAKTVTFDQTILNRMEWNASIIFTGCHVNMESFDTVNWKEIQTQIWKEMNFTVDHDIKWLHFRGCLKRWSASYIFRCRGTFKNTHTKTPGRLPGVFSSDSLTHYTICGTHVIQWPIGTCKLIKQLSSVLTKR